jgi:hypothetical protein
MVAFLARSSRDDAFLKRARQPSADGCPEFECAPQPSADGCPEFECASPPTAAVGGAPEVSLQGPFHAHRYLATGCTALREVYC